MNIKELANIQSGIVKRQLKFNIDGKEYTADAYFKRLSFIDVVDELSNTEDITQQERIAAQIASSLVDENGSYVFTKEQILGVEDPNQGPLSAEMFWPIWNAIIDINGLGKIVSSQETMSSGVSSSSMESEEIQ